jgi:CheY-like chemotaxis protein
VRGKAEALDKAVRDATLAKTHGFLKLNLRRVDAVAYYGPTALLVYLPRMDSRSAAATLTRLHGEFLQEHKDRNIVIGLASFPANGSDVEGLVEKAEAAVKSARLTSNAKHVVAYEAMVKSAPAHPAAAMRERPTQIEPVPVVSPTPASSLGVEKVEEPIEESIEEPIKESLPEPARESAPEIVVETAPEPVVESIPESVEVNVPDTVIESVPEPVEEIILEPVEEVIPEPVKESAPETVSESAPEPLEESVPEPAVETTPEPVKENVPATIKEVSPEPITESIPETAEPLAARRSEARLNPAAAMSAQEMARMADKAAARELELRASGAVMPRRLLLTISDAARMTQLNSLIRAAGYEARAAFDGQQALHLLRIERPDLLLLDYELQGIDGVEMIRRLRKQSGGRLSLPVVMILSGDNEQARSEALELGAHSVHTIPYDPAELLSNIRRAGSAE